ncbi:hypothetical protein H310_07000 [Aphanomyces invadans]|uniref:Amino acid transporter n=1 Tax=Aphanomyces invadans TaxID=157072 RepID=A0A024U286_9STRA|nr:hypothetical protein H310_07000 [Aphanomyces invadans]ETW00354.1 hypothetical protein H310_07000 [Aphanomyces invadans]|eukprot:XP_008870489.1 hypothetical protein H310_07000 [Aphanomyces invadans]
MASSRPKIILFSGDLPPAESPGQPTSTNYTELSHDFTRKTAKKFDTRDESPMYHFPHHQRHHHQAPQSHQPHQIPPKQVPDKFVSIGQAAYAVGSKHMSIAAYSRANMRMSWGVMAGIAIGAVLVNWGSYMEDGTISPTMAHWIGLLGGLYLRAVFCIVVPMVFASMSLGIAEILRIGKGRRIAWRVLGYFLLTKLFAACVGLAMALAFQSKFTPLEFKTDITPGLASLRCGPGNMNFITASASGVVTCESKPNGANMSSSLFVMKDTNNVFSKNPNPNSIPSTKVGQALLVLSNDIIPDNVVRAMVSTNILSIAMFAVIFGAAVCKNYRQNSTGTHHVMDLLRQVNFVCELFAEWLLVMSPIPLCTLVAGAFAEGQATAKDSFLLPCVYFIVAYVSAIAIYSGLVLPLFLFVTTKINPYAYLSSILPAQLFAFSSSSSAATIPFTLRCVENTQQVSSSVARFTVILGAPLNKDGCALYLPMSMVFIAKIANISIAPASYPYILALSIVSSVVTLPLPNSAPITLYSIWTAVQVESFPTSISFLVWINWLVDRIATVINVTGDTVVARIVAHQVDESVVSDQDTAAPDSY